jgi:hypothetical protein
MSPGGKMIRNFLEITFLVAFVVGTICGLEWLYERNVLSDGSYNKYMAEGREKMKYFDQDVPLTEADAKIAISTARQAVVKFLAAKQYGDPGWELEDAKTKYLFWTENLEKLRIARFEQRITTANDKFTQAVDKVRNR